MIHHPHDQSNESIGPNVYTGEKIFEHPVEFFFDARYQGYALDVELIASKAEVVELKILHDQKVEEKVPHMTAFVIFTFNCNELSNLGPILTSDWGMGRKVL